MKKTTSMMRKSRKPAVDIFDYIDYRRYLEDYYKARKEQDSYFSCRYIAQKVGFRSASFFSQIIKGRSNVSSAMVLRFAQFLKLNKKETDYFETLVQFCQAKTHEEKKRAFERLMSCRGAKVSILDADRYEYFDKWYYTVIRELLYFYPFYGDYHELASLLNPPIRPEDARKAIEVLERLGLIYADESGRYVRREQCGISTGEGDRSVAIDNYHRTTLDMGKNAIDTIPRGERTISTLTLSLSKNAYDTINEELAAFRRRIMDIAANDQHETKVYQYNFQVFPTTREYRHCGDKKR